MRECGIITHLRRVYLLQLFTSAVNFGVVTSDVFWKLDSQIFLLVSSFCSRNIRFLMTYAKHTPWHKASFVF